MGRAWRMGQTDAAIGSAGLRVLHRYAGTVDAQGNELAVTEVAIADEIAAAADLVKGKLGGLPRPWSADCPWWTTAPRARDLLRPVNEDLFAIGTAEAIAQGRREAVLLRRSIRSFSAEPVDPDALRRAIAVGLTAPAPHHTHPVRFVWVRNRPLRAKLLDAMRAAWRADLRGDGWSEERIDRRVARGDLLYGADRDSSSRSCVPDGAHDYPDQRRGSAETTMFTVGRRRGRPGPAGRAGRGGPRLLLGLLDPLRRGRRARRAGPAGRLGAAGRGRRRPPGGRPARPSRTAPRPAECLVEL